jgi:predicted DNA-binding transcriptional regulator AlpA
MSATATHSKLLSSGQAAAFLGVQPQTLAVWRSSKRYPDLRYVKVGSAVKYRQSDLEQWLQRRTVGEPT